MPAVLELDTNSRSKKLKREQEECVIVFIEGKAFHLGKAYNISLYHWWPSRKYSNPIVVDADWLKAGPVVSE